MGKKSFPEVKPQCREDSTFPLWKLWLSPFVPEDKLHKDLWDTSSFGAVVNSTFKHRLKC